MAVVGMAKEKAELREARKDNTERYYKLVFLVEVNNIKDDAMVVMQAFGLPYLGMQYATNTSVDPFAKCYNMLFNQIALLFWEVVCEYTTKIDSNNKDKEFEPPEYSWGGTNIREVVTGQSVFDQKYPDGVDPTNVILLSSTGILNSAYEPFCPPAEMDRMIPTLTFTRFEPLFNHRFMLYYVNSVNSSRWFGWWPRTVKISSITGELQLKLVSNNIKKYWRVQYTFQFNKLTWDLFLLDIGSYYFKGGFAAVPKNKQPFMAKNVPTLGLLQADGDRSTTFTQNFRRFRVLDEIDFYPLMIPMIT